MRDGVDVHLKSIEEEAEAKRTALELKQKKAAARAAAIARAAAAQADPALTYVVTTTTFHSVAIYLSDHLLPIAGGSIA